MENIYPVAKLGDQILLIHKSDVPFVGKERALEVMCVKVDLRNQLIDEPTELEKHLKFNPWEEIMDENDRGTVLKILNTKFSDQDIQEKIVKVLEKRK